MRLVLALLASIFISTQGLAQTKPINFAAVITDQDDVPITECQRADPAVPVKCVEELPLTLGRLCLRLLGATAEQGVTDDEKYHRFDLAMQIYKSKEPMPLLPSDLALVKKLLGKSNYSIIVYGRVVQMLDGKS